MSPNDANSAVWELVRGHAGRAKVLGEFGIDYCCGGRTSLREACSRRGLDTEDVLRALEENDDSLVAADQIDWFEEPLTRLCNHIVSRHHAYLRGMLPQLGRLLDEVVASHGKEHPNLFELRGVYTAMCSELLNHMMKEERVLFPFIRSLEQALEVGEPAPHFHCGSVRAPIHVMEDEHQNTGEALRRMRQLTFDFQPPKDACRAYRLLMLGFRELEGDIHLHIHKENDILFPRATAAEGSLTAEPAFHNE